MADTISCPTCQTEIEISEALSSRLKSEVMRQLQEEKNAREKEWTRRDSELTIRAKQLAAARESFDQELAQRLDGERQRLLQEAATKAKADVAHEVSQQAEELAEVRQKLLVAQSAELAVRKKARELEDQKREAELAVNRTLDDERGKIREQAKREVLAERELKEADKDKLITDLRREITDLQRRSEQGSQQLQGEVMELGLEEQLRRVFPLDELLPVPKGIHGGDIVHCIHDGVRGVCGSILWESKRTKAWSDGWLPKLRDDQRSAKSQIAVIVSVELPPGISTFGQIDGVWIAGWQYALPLAAVLRTCVIQTSMANRALEGRHDKMELLYTYLAGPEFKHHMEGIVEAFVTLREELEREKRSTQRAWAKRDKQLNRALLNTASMYGDLQGIIGQAMPRIAHLDEPALLTDESNSG